MKKYRSSIFVFCKLQETMKDSITETENKKDIFDKFGCAIYGIATILFALQRYLLFSYTIYLSTTGNQIASSILEFLFGNSPYSFIDVLLGVEIPEEGLLLVLQPRIWALAVVQAVHIGLNIGLVAIPFWLKHKIDKASGVLKWFWYVSLVSILVISIIVILQFVSTFPKNSSIYKETTLPVEENIQYQQFSNSEYGLHFNYPSYLTIQDELSKDRGSSGEIIKTIHISATSTVPLVGIIVQSIEDPLRDVLFPNLYPPSDETFKILIISDLTEFEVDDTEENKFAITDASKNSIMTKISGHHAAVYKLSLTSSTYGHIYMRGALVITSSRDISIFIIGSDEPNIRGSVSVNEIDLLWKEFIESVEIDY